MSMRHVIPVFLLFTLALPALAAIPPESPLWAKREWERIPSTTREGMDTVTAVLSAFPPREVGLAVIQDVDPAQNDRLIGAANLRYNGHARWGWSSVAPDVALGAATPAQKVTQGPLRELNVLESQGERVMADFVWSLLVGEEVRGSFVLRCVFYADEPSWVYVCAFVAGDPNLWISGLRLHSWGGFVRLDPGAEQWTAGLTTHGVAPARGPLPLDEYWFFAAHQAHTEAWLLTRGSAGVFLPDQLEQLEYQGGGSLRLVPVAGSRAVCWTMRDFNEPTEPWLAVARADAPRRQQRLAEMVWRPDMARELQLLDDHARPLLEGLAEQSPTVVAWQKERATVEQAAQAAQGTDPGSPEELAWGTTVQAARLALESLWATAAEEFLPAGAAGE